MTEIKPPAKIQNLIDRMTGLGLTVKFTPDDRPNAFTTIHTWTISSPNPHEMDSVFVYWSPGKRGGTVHYTLYRPYAKNRRSRAVRTTRARAVNWMTMVAAMAQP